MNNSNLLIQEEFSLGDKDIITNIVSRQLKCRICGSIVVGNIKFFIHVKRFHNMTSKEYYDKYLKTNNEGLCLVCGKQTNFENSTRGYSKHCSADCSNKSEYRNSKIVKPDTLQKRIATCRRLYDRDNVFQHIPFQEKYQNTCELKYNVDNTFKIDWVIDKIRDHRSMHPVPSCWQKEYWNKRGYSDKEATIIISKRSSRNLNFFIEKYGQDLGFKKYNEMVEKRKFSFSLEGNIKQYGEEEGTKRYHGIIKSKLSFNSGISSSSCVFIDFLENEFKNAELTYSFIREYPISKYVVDLYIPELKSSIEFYGDYWHANKNLNMVFKDIDTTNLIYEKDKERISNLYKNEKISKIAIVWECAATKFKNGCFTSILNFLRSHNNFLELNMKNNELIEVCKNYDNFE